jgi:hypothetical protein
MEGPRTTNTDAGSDTGGVSEAGGPGTDATGTSAQDTPQVGGRHRGRMLWGKSMVDSAMALTHLRALPVTSKVILSETEQRHRRRILITNDFFEVHQVLQVNEDMIKLQIYLLA